MATPNIVPRLDGEGSIGRADKKWGKAYINDIVDSSNILTYGANGDGVTDNSAAFTAALAAIDTAESTLYLPAGTYVLGADITIPENVCLKFDKGAVLSVSDTYTLTINGAIDAGLWQIFTGAGSFAGSPQIPSVFPEWFGAKADGITDDAAAINKAAAFCYIDESNSINLVLQAKTYNVESTVVLACSGDLKSGTITSDASFSPTVSVGLPDLNYIFGLQLALPKIINSTKGSSSGGWGTDRVPYSGAVGVEFVNLYQSNIYIHMVQGFSVGALVRAESGKGNCYNLYTISHLYNNKVNLKISPSDAGSWVNENIFHGGRFSHLSGESTNPSGTRHILLTRDAYSGVGAPNNNRFMGCSLEGDLEEYTVDIWGIDNSFFQCRWEGTAKARMYSSASPSETIDNTFIGGYDVSSISFTSAGAGYGPTQRYGTRQWGLMGNGIKILPSSGNIPILEGFKPGRVDFMNGHAYSETDWSARLMYNSLLLKRDTDAYPRVKVDGGTGRIYLADEGSIESTSGMFGIAGDICVSATQAFLPIPTNTMSLGSSGYKWTEVFATTGTINTSDAREKQQIRDLDDAEKAVALKIKKLIKAFKFNDAVEKKGTEARIHVGVVAQEVAEAFISEGLDPHRYSLFCYDEWDETPEEVTTWEDEFDKEGNLIRAAGSEVILEKVPAGNAYGIRYDELLAFVISAI